jgi:hypothetical protein
MNGSYVPCCRSWSAKAGMITTTTRLTHLQYSSGMNSNLFCPMVLSWTGNPNDPFLGGFTCRAGSRSKGQSAQADQCVHEQHFPNNHLLTAAFEAWWTIDNPRDTLLPAVAAAHSCSVLVLAGPTCNAGMVAYYTIQDALRLVQLIPRQINCQPLPTASCSP